MIVRLVAGFRVSFDIGNYPVSTMFSYVQVNDGEFHTVELSITGAHAAVCLRHQSVCTYTAAMTYHDVHEACTLECVNLILIHA